MSDLREALEKLAAELEYDVAGAPGKIRALLAAYPAESAPADLRALVERWRAFKATSSNPGDPEDDGFANGTEWGHLRHQAKELHRFITEYGKVAG